MPRFEEVRDGYDEAVRSGNESHLLTAADANEPPGTRNSAGRRIFDTYLTDATAYLEGR